jgi:hypothetical protein
MEDIKDLSIPRDANARPAACVFGFDPATGLFYPLAVEAVGDGTFKLKVAANITVGDIEIGAVEIKDYTSDERVGITADHKILAKADDDPMQKLNITTIYTYVVSGDGEGKVATVKEYPSGAAGGTPAKLTTYSYNSDSKVTSIAVTNTTV